MSRFILLAAVIIGCSSSTSNRRADAQDARKQGANANPAGISSDQLEESIKKYKKMGLLANYDLPTHMIEFEGKRERADLIYLYKCIEFANEKLNANLDGFVFNSDKFPEKIVNFVIIDKDPENLFSKFWGNCTYTGHKNIIVCDLNFMHEIAGLGAKQKKLDEDRREAVEQGQAKALKELGSRPAGPEKTGMPPGKMSDAEIKEYIKSLNPVGQIQAMRAGIAFWVLGHEVGHLAHGHKKRHFYFKDEDGANFINNANGKPAGDDFRIEQEADDFAYKVAEADGRNGIGYYMWMGASQAVQSYAIKTLREQHAGDADMKLDDVWSVADRKYRIVSQSRTHPPIFYRIAELGQRLADDLKLDDTGFFRKIRDNITIVH